MSLDQQIDTDPGQPDFGNLLRAGDVQHMLLPGVGAHAPLAQAFRRGTGFDGQQTQAGLQL